MTPPSRGPCLLLLSIHSESTLARLVSSSLLSHLRTEPWATSLFAVVHSSPFVIRRSLAFKQMLSELPPCAHLSLPDGEEVHLQVHVASSLMHERVRGVAPFFFPPLVSTGGELRGVASNGESNGESNGIESNGIESNGIESSGIESSDMQSHDIQSTPTRPNASISVIVEIASFCNMPDASIGHHIHSEENGADRDAADASAGIPSVDGRRTEWLMPIRMTRSHQTAIRVLSGDADGSSGIAALLGNGIRASQQISKRWR